MDSKILEILLSLKEDITAMKADVKDLKEKDAKFAEYLKSEVRPLVVSHSRINWLSNKTFTILISFGSLMGVFSAAASIFGK